MGDNSKVQLIKSLVVREVLARSRDISSARDVIIAIPEPEASPVKKRTTQFETVTDAKDELHFWLKHATTDALKTVRSIKTGRVAVMKDNAINALKGQ